MTGSSHTHGFGEELDSRYRERLMAYFMRRLRDRSAAEDLTQDLFARLIAPGTPVEVQNRDAFVFAAAANLLKDRARRSNARPERRMADLAPAQAIAEDSIASDEDFTPERVLIGRESLADTLAALSELGERTRDIFILFRVEGMKQREIAKRYGISVSAVEKHVVRAVVHLASRRQRA